MNKRCLRIGSYCCDAPSCLVSAEIHQMKSFTSMGIMTQIASFLCFVCHMVPVVAKPGVGIP
jgi:hypothetical protein